MPRGTEIWDVDGDYDKDPSRVTPIIDYRGGDLTRSEHECVWCDEPTETNGTCAKCAAIPLGERND